MARVIEFPRKIFVQRNLSKSEGTRQFQSELSSTVQRRQQRSRALWHASSAAALLASGAEDTQRLGWVLEDCVDLICGRSK